MTDEERQKLCKILRECGDRHFDDMVADEIERLAAENRKLKKSLHHMSSARETDMGTAE